MREKFVCRFCETTTSEMISHQNSYQRVANRQAFAISGSSPHNAPGRPFRPESILLDLNIDPVSKTLSGKAVQHFQAIAPDQTSLVLDQIGLEIENVEIDGKKASSHCEGQSVVLSLESTPKPGQTI